MKCQNLLKLSEKILLGITTAYVSSLLILEMFYLNSTFFGILPVLVFQFRSLLYGRQTSNGLTAQPKGTTARWHSNKTSQCSWSRLQILTMLFKGECAVLGTFEQLIYSLVDLLRNCLICYRTPF